MSARKTPAVERRPRRTWLGAVVGHFFRGIVVVVPIAVTISAIYWTFRQLDTWINVEPLLNRRIPGAGIVLTVVVITTVGFLASNFATRWIFRWIEALLDRTPLVKLIYSSIKDLVGAFVGEKKKFDRPVLVNLTQDVDVGTIGFVTRDSLKGVGRGTRLAVYVPQAYNIGGTVVLVPSDRVKPLDADPSAVMTFVVSGGVTGDIERAADPAPVKGG